MIEALISNFPIEKLVLGCNPYKLVHCVQTVLYFNNEIEGL